MYPCEIELVNKFIQIDKKKDNTVFETTCVVTEDDLGICLTYTLVDNDCLFDFSHTFNKVQIKVAHSYFEKYEQPLILFIKKQSICCNIQSKLYELINCNFEGLVRKVYLESIVLYLLFYLQRNNLVFGLNCDGCSFLNKPIELDKIQKAKDFIINNLDQNITIPIIAGFVGANQCYLKKGFKEVTGQTIFEYVQENRMVKARHLLQHSGKSIQEISMAVGYASISSFSQTYKNFFGLAPSLEQKQIIPNN